MSAYEGSCLCGEVNYRIDGDMLNAANCHCNFCRSHTGAAFASYAAFAQPGFSVSHGAEKISSFNTGGGRKHFCSNCGTPIYNLNEKYPGLCLVYLGTLAQAREISPKINIWCESKLPWVDALAAIPSLAQGIAKK